MASHPASPPPQRIAIVARDYAFDAPDTLAAGPATFQLTNRGRMQHELVIFGARPGVSAAQMLNAPTAEARRALADPMVGVLFAPTSRPVSAELQTTLEAGRWYILFCGIRDSLNMPVHYQLGMVDSFYVR